MARRKGMAGALIVLAVAGAAAAGGYYIISKQFKVSVSPTRVAQNGTLTYKISNGTRFGGFVVNSTDGHNITSLGAGTFDQNGYATGSVNVPLIPGDYQFEVIDSVASAANNYNPYVIALTPFTVI